MPGTQLTSAHNLTKQQANMPSPPGAMTPINQAPTPSRAQAQELMEGGSLRSWVEACQQQEADLYQATDALRWLVQVRPAQSLPHVSQTRLACCGPVRCAALSCSAWLVQPQRPPTALLQTPQGLPICVPHVAEGLAYLHSREPLVIHRDVKLDNILLSSAWGDTRGVEQ